MLATADGAVRRLSFTVVVTCDDFLWDPGLTARIADRLGDGPKFLDGVVSVVVMGPATTMQTGGARAKEGR